MMSVPVGLVLVAASAAIWLIVLAAVLRATTSPEVPDHPPTAELGPESPAVVEMITSGWKVGDDAASATLLDLAARQLVGIDEIGPELSLVRPRRNVDATRLAPYEQLVFAHVINLATADGVVPTQALAEGARDLRAWRRKFNRAVRDEVRRAGLSEPRFAAVHHVILWVAATLPIAAIGYVGSTAVGEDGKPLDIVGVGFIAIAAIMGLIKRLSTDRGTLAGARAAARWRGVRKHLGRARFDDKPAAAVTIWGRPLAYAAALGIGGLAVASLPVSTPPDNNKAWSDHGGMWHQVHVHYGGRGLFGRILWGRSPWAAAKRAALAGLGTTSVVYTLFILAFVFLEVRSATMFLLALLPPGILVTLVLMALTDRGTATVVTGQVVRSRRMNDSDTESSYRYWIAVDDGRSRRIHAFGVGEEEWSTITEGDIIDAQVGRWLGWIYNVTVRQPSRHKDTC